MRRTVLLVLLLVLTGRVALPGEKPLWKAGIVTDTHVSGDRASCQWVEAAMRLFARQGVDLFAHCGDIANVYDPAGYRHLRAIADAAFAGRKVRELWVYAGHDWGGRKSESFETVAADVQRHLGAANGPYDSFDIQGDPVVTFPQDYDRARVEAMIRQAVADHPGRPVFVFEHVPPLDVADNSISWGSAELRELFAKYPQVIALNGHAHSSLRSELNIWQGEFTSVNVGCLHYWNGHVVGGPGELVRNYGAVVMEVYANRVVFRRFDVRTGREYAADQPWTVPLPFDPQAAPYRRDRRAACEPVPEFPAGASLKIQPSTPFSVLSLKFPRAGGAHGCYRYQIDICSDAPGASARIDMMGLFHLDEAARPPERRKMIGAGFFDAGRRYVIRVTPFNCFGGAGRPLEAAFTAPAPRRGEVLADCADPLARLGMFEDGRLARRCTVEDGWVKLVRGYPLMPLGDVRNGRFRVVFEAETDQGGPQTMQFQIRCAGAGGPVSQRVQTVPGRSDPTRYAIEFDVGSPRGPVCLAAMDVNGRFRIANLRVERVPSAAAAVEQAYAELWGRFVSPRGILYDYIGELPTAKDCDEARPNAMGWWSPIENGPMFTGPFLAAMSGRARRTGSAEDRARCRRLAEGLLLCAEVCGTPGMICRGVGADGRCHYPLGSTDQTVPWFFGLDAYVRSGLPEPAFRRKVVDKMVEVAEAIERFNWRCPCDGRFRGQSRGNLYGDGLPFRGATHFLLILRALADATGAEKWKKAYVAARDEKYPGGYEETRLDVCAYGYRFDKERSHRVFEMEKGQFWIYVCAQGCLAELARREEDPVAAARYREGLVRGAECAHRFMGDYVNYHNDAERPFRYANWRAGWNWREQKTQADADRLAGEGKWEVLGRRKQHERLAMTTPLAAAAICAYAGMYWDEVRATIAHYDYSTPAISEFFFAPLA